MDQSQPYFTLHNGKIMLVNAPKTTEEKEMLNSSYYIGENDDMSFTSSTMSEDFSVGEPGDGEDDESFYTSDEEDVDLDVPLQPKSLGSVGRSTVSLDGAVLKSRTCLSASMPAMSISQQMRVARTKSMASMVRAKQPEQRSRLPGTIAHAWQQPSAQQQPQSCPATAALAAEEATNPNDHLAKLLQVKTLQTVSYDSLTGYFLPTRPEHIAAWDANLLKAIRHQDLAMVKDLHQSGGKPLQACNRFGESILHVCVRRGTPEILQYLLQEGNVTPRVCCDYGRTALHDAAWVLSNNPKSFDMMGLLLERCPEMLLITDKRGFTPLNYVPKDRWASCCEFLDQHAALLQQRLKKKRA